MVLDIKFRIRWSHHEKLVVVDKKVAFLGGLDLCSVQEHRLMWTTFARVYGDRHYT